MRRLYVRLALIGAALFTFAGLASAASITGVAETGTGLAPEGVYYTGQTFDHPNEGVGFTVPSLDEDVPSYADRNHEYNGISATETIAALGLVGAEYVMMANDNRGVGDYQLSVTVDKTVDTYVMMDARLTQPSWLRDEGWGLVGHQYRPDGLQGTRLGIDEGGNGVGPGDDINQQFLIWGKENVPAGTIVTKERGGTGNNMYGVVITDPGAGPGVDPVTVKPIPFSYSTLEKGGTISGMLDTTHVGGSGDVLFTAAMPTPVTVDPNPGLTPAGAVGTITEQQGSHNEAPHKTVGLDWSGMGPVELKGTDGINYYSVLVDLIFGPSGDRGYRNDIDDPLSNYDPLLGPDYLYTWAIPFSDDALEEHGGDAVSPGGSDNPRMAVYLGVGREEENGGSHRFTQSEYQFDEGPDAHTNTHESSGATKSTKYAAYRDLGIFFGWRDRENIADGSFHVDSITFAGNLPVDIATMTSAPVPEPSTVLMLASLALAGLLLWKRRR